MKPQIIKAKDLKPGDLLIHYADHEKISVGSFKFIKSIEKPKKIDKDNKDERLVFFILTTLIHWKKQKRKRQTFY